jgi:hypothetical protein
VVAGGAQDRCRVRSGPALAEAWRAPTPASLGPGRRGSRGGGAAVATSVGAEGIAKWRNDDGVNGGRGGAAMAAASMGTEGRGLAECRGCGGGGSRGQRGGASRSGGDAAASASAVGARGGGRGGGVEGLAEWRGCGVGRVRGGRLTGWWHYVKGYVVQPWKGGIFWEVNTVHAVNRTGEAMKPIRR